jgi:hypothetical protein
MSRLRSHRPSGAVPPPIVLVDGAEKVGKSFHIAKFTGSSKVGRCYWIEYGSGERTAEYYGRVPGADYEIVEHNNTWPGLINAVDEITEDITETYTLGEPPPVIVLDSATGEWKTLSRWAEWRARNSEKAKRILARDPHAEITVGHAYWNPATARHEDLLARLERTPAIIIVTARSREVSAFDAAGNIIPNTKVWSVAAQKDIGFWADAAVRLRRGEKPELWALRTVVDSIDPADPKATERLPSFDLEALIFGRMGFDPANAATRAVRDTSGLADPGDEFDRIGEFTRRAIRATTDAELVVLQVEAQAAKLSGAEPTLDGDGNDTTLADLIKACRAALTAPASAAVPVVVAVAATPAASVPAAVPPGSLTRLKELLGQVPVKLDTPAAKATLVGELVNRHLTKASELTADELDDVITLLETMLAADDKSDVRFAQMMSEPKHAAVPVAA